MQRANSPSNPYNTRLMKFLPARIDVERRADGTLVLRSPEPLKPYRRCLGDYLEEWAERTPDHPFLAQRSGADWRKLTYGEARRRVRQIAAALLKRGLTTETPVAILSDNSIEHALLTLAAMHVGIPAAPLSPSYSLASKDHAKLKSIFELVQPRLVFADNADKFAAAFDALRGFEFETVTNLDTLNEKEDAAVERAFAAVTPDTIGKLLLTSGSTGHPKAVINTQRMMCSNQASYTQVWPFLLDEPPVLVEWLPWNHTFGGNNNFNLVLANGGTFYIDEGKPVDRKSTRLNSSHVSESRMPSSA